MSATPEQPEPVTLRVNGETVEIAIHDDETLVETLRERLRLRSVRATCGIGICGTCTVQVDGRVASACLLLTRQASQRDIRTSEGLVEEGGELGRVQQAFVDRHAYQCAYCIPGMVVTVDAALQTRPDATVEDLREELAGNLCRCGTYMNILEAVAQLVGGDEAERRQPDEQV